MEYLVGVEALRALMQMRVQEVPVILLVRVGQMEVVLGAMAEEQAGVIRVVAMPQMDLVE